MARGEEEGKNGSVEEQRAIVFGNRAEQGTQGSPGGSGIRGRHGLVKTEAKKIETKKKKEELT
jgi:hypothetical protein